MIRKKTMSITKILLLTGFAEAMLWTAFIMQIDLFGPQAYNFSVIFSVNSIFLLQIEC